MSFINNAPSSNDISTESSEESGWTMYLEDFFNNQKCSMSLSGVANSSSLVSDAASLARKNNIAGCKQAEEFNSVNKNGKRSSFKKRKNIITALVDDALEDTASSSLNSPEVHLSSLFFSCIIYISIIYFLIVKVCYINVITIIYPCHF